MRWLSATLLLGLLSVGLANPAWAIDPRLDWKTLQTEHFDMHFAVQHEPIARRLAADGEAAWATLTRMLEHTPSERVQVILTDEVDTANGSASVAPYNRVVLLLAPPPPFSTINDYDDWLRLLFVHELAHIVHINMTYGLPWLVNLLLGKTWTPNALWPRWFVEGLAVYLETLLSGGHGRVHSSWTRMMLRAEVLAGDLPPLSELTGPSLRWPRGARSYNFGGPFFSFLVGRCGMHGVRKMLRRYGSRPVPYAVGRTMDQACGDGVEANYALWQKRVTRRAREELEEIQARGATRVSRLTTGGETRRRPRWLPDARRFIYYRSDGRDDQYLVHAELVPKDDSAELVEHNLFEAVGYAGHDVSADGRWMVVSQSGPWQEFYRFHDLDLLPLHEDGRRAGPPQRLTQGMRALDPAFSPDGRRIVFVAQGADRSDLFELDLDRVGLEGPRRLTRLPLGSHVEGPRYAPDGRSVALSSHWAGSQSRDIFLLDLEHCRRRPCTSPGTPVAVDRAIDFAPVFSRDGRWLYFVSDRSETYNVHAFSLETAEERQVTNVLTAVHEPAPAPYSDADPGLALVYGYRGWDVAMLPMREVDFRAVSAPKRPPPPRPRDAEPEVEPVVDVAPPPVESDYSPWWTLLPRTWSPLINEDSIGQTLGLLTSGADALGLHAWNFSYEYGLDSDSHAFDLNWRMRYGRPSLGLGISRRVIERFGPQRRNGRTVPYDEETLRLRSQVTFPISMPQSRHVLSLRYDARYGRPLEGAAPFEPDQVPPTFFRDGWDTTLGLSWTYSNVETRLYGMGGQEGYRLSLGASYSGPELGGTGRRSMRVSAGWTGYLQMPFRSPWAQHQVLASTLRGAAGEVQGGGALFGLGGPPQRDVVFDLLFGEATLGGSFLRGYPRSATFGEIMLFSSTEYRVPLYDFDQGLAALPFFFRRLIANVFVDAGAAWFGTPDLRDTLISVGTELGLELTIEYNAPLLLRLGYARGLRRGGIHDYYLLTGLSF